MDLFKKENMNTMITIRMTKNDRDKINNYCKGKNIKTTEYIRNLIKVDMEKENK